MEQRDETFAVVERLKKRLVDAVSDASGQVWAKACLVIPSSGG